MVSTVNSFVMGRQLSQLERLAVLSFIAHGHSYRLFSYHRPDNLPAGAVWENADTVVANNRGMNANWFRWAFLSRMGGMWVDIDIVCLRPIAFEKEWVCVFDSINRVSTSFIKAPRHHPLMTSMYKKSCRPRLFALLHPEAWPCLKRWSGARVRDCLGEQLDGAPEFSRIILRREESLTVLPPYHFYPVQEGHAKTLFDESYQENPDPFYDSQGVCLFAQQKPYQLANQGQVNQESFVAQLMRKHL